MPSPPCPPQSRVRRSLQPRPKSRIHPLFLSTSAVLLSSPCSPCPRRHRARETIAPLSAPCPVTSAGDPPTPTATTATPTTTTTTTTTLTGWWGLSRVGGLDWTVSHDDHGDAGAAAARGRLRYAAPRHRAQLLLSRAGPDRAGAAAVQQEDGQIAGARHLSPSVDTPGSR